MGFHYVARRPLKVSGRMVQPGEIVPEAETWRDIQTYVDNGSLAVAVEVPKGAIENAALREQVADLRDRVAALERLVAGEDGEDPDIQFLASAGIVDGYLDADDLRTWDRARLDELAAELGIENAGERETEDLIAELVTIPVQASAEEGEDTGDGAPTGETGEATPPAAPVDLSNWKLEPLLALAKQAGIKDPKFTKKADAVAAIEAATTPEQLAELVAASEDRS